MTLTEQLKSFTWPFWAANIMEMFERLAYYGVRTVIPIYIASVEDPMGLHFTHTQKGEIFAWWALVQSLLPIFTGGFADRYGYKKTIAFSISLKIIGYVLMATQREFYPFLFGCLILGAGTAIFKPGIQGSLAQGLNNKNSSLGWGFFYQLVNIGGFLGPPLAGFLHRLSWPYVFYGCALIVSLNYFTLLTYKEVHSGGVIKGNALEVIKLTVKEFFKPRLLCFILIISGLWLVLYQLWDMLPNFIEDWIDSSSIVAVLGLSPGLLVAETSRGLQIKQEWLINLNAGMIVLFMIPVAMMTGKVRRLVSIVIGTLLASFGLMLAGFSMSGWFCLFGIFIFSFGEMASSPKMREYLGYIAPAGKKGLYLGYANMPEAIGWTYGSIMAGRMYDAEGDKALMALRYLKEHLGFSQTALEKISRTEALGVLQNTIHKTPTEITQLLWNTYHPYKLWIPFAAIGLASAVGMIIYSRFAKKWVDSNA